MAYLTAKKVKGKSYYQIVESHREGGGVHKRVLLHLGTDLARADTLLKWWNYLGQPPRVPLRAGETIVDLQLFLRRSTAVERQRAAEGLKFLMEQSAESYPPQDVVSAGS